MGVAGVHMGVRARLDVIVRDIAHTHIGTHKHAQSPHPARLGGAAMWRRAAFGPACAPSPSRDEKDASPSASSGIDEIVEEQERLRPADGAEWRRVHRLGHRRRRGRRRRRRRGVEQPGRRVTRPPLRLLLEPQPARGGLARHRRLLLEQQLQRAVAEGRGRRRRRVARRARGRADVARRARGRRVAARRRRRAHHSHREKEAGVVVGFGAQRLHRSPRLRGGGGGGGGGGGLRREAHRLRRLSGERL